MDNNTVEKIVNKSSTSARWLSIGGILLVVIGMTFYFMQNTHLASINREITDSLTITNNLLTTTEKLSHTDSLNRDSIKHRLMIFFVNKPKTNDDYRMFYTDTLKRFYLKENMTLNEILQKKLYVAQKNTPRSKIEYDIDNDVSIDFGVKDTFQIYANVRYYFDSLKSSKNIIYQLKMNKEYKIFFVRNLLPLQQALK